ncbi:MAG: NAD-dependent epimerase/dehydratase family protein [Bryobacteraceae bacterium]
MTGGSGFIGTALISELIRSGHQVLALSRTDESDYQARAGDADVDLLGHYIAPAS